MCDTLNIFGAYARCKFECRYKIFNTLVLHILINFFFFYYYSAVMDLLFPYSHKMS